MSVAEQPANEVVLWGSGTPRTFRAIWIAEELGLEYQLEGIGPRTGETQTQEYTDLNPKQKIPTCTDGSFVVSESVVISKYLIDTYDDSGLFFRPQTTVQQVRFDEWCYFIYGEIDETSLYVIRRHDDLAAIYGEAPGAIEGAKVYLQRQLAVVEETMTGPFLMGDQIGLPDILLMSCLDWALIIGLTVPTRVQAYHARMAERLAYKRAVAINYNLT